MRGAGLTIISMEIQPIEVSHISRDAAKRLERVALEVYIFREVPLNLGPYSITSRPLPDPTLY